MTAITRRRMLALGAAGAAASVLSAAHAYDPCKPPQKWDVTTEVLVIGSGGAGLAAAVSAAEAGAKATVMEKLNFIGGNTLLCSGYYNCVDPGRQKKQGIEDSVALHVRQTLDAGDNRGNPELVEVLCSKGLETLEWLEGMGMKFAPEVTQVYGALYRRSHLATESKGAGYIKVLKKKADELGVSFLMGTKMKSIVREGAQSGRVLGVEATDAKGKTIFVRATKGVVLAAGGYSANPQLRSLYDPRLLTLCTTNNVACSTGEVMLAANAAGAMLIGTDYIQCNPGPAPGHQNGIRQSLHLEVEKYIYVDQRGHRFVAEDARRDVLRDAVLALPEKYGYVIVDADGFAANPAAAQNDAKRGLKTGDSFTADTLADLAKQLKIDPAELQKTVDEFNECVDKKSDPKFGRKPEMLTSKILKGPFWAAYSAMAVHHTMGGVRIDTSARVMDLEGKVIPGLYAAGEVTGGIHGSNRVGGNAVLDIHVFGRIAGKSAASEA